MITVPTSGDMTRSRRIKLLIGLLGGTFDPIHIGHLVIAQEACSRFELDKVIFVPNGSPPHKENDSGASAWDRAEMVRLAIEGNESFELSEIELHGSVPAFTIDTVIRLKRSGPPDASYYFIVGSDSLLDLPNWKDPLGLLSECRLIAASRPGYIFDEKTPLSGMLTAEDEAKASVQIMPVPGIDISSSGIRERIAQGKPFRYLVPDPVWHFILGERLYL